MPIGACEMNYQNLFNLQGKKVVICGAGGLIGKELVSCFMAHKAEVIALDLKKPVGQPAGVLVLEADINSENSLTANLDQIYKEKGAVDCWINCAYPRTSDWGKSLEEANLDWFNKNNELHLGGYFLSSKMILERMKSQGKGSLVNFSSIYGVVGPNFTVYENLPMTNPVAYSAIKAGIINLSRYLATYYGPQGLRVNCLSPGGVFDNQNPEFVKRYSQLTPMRRMAKKEEIAGAAVFLASDASSYMTGQNLVVDGGWTAQ